MSYNIGQKAPQILVTMTQENERTEEIEIKLLKNPLLQFLLENVARYFLKPKSLV